MHKKNIVTIGGGTGGFTLLSGLKNYPFNISAVVSMADDGGSTGRLRDELGVLPPGDIRQCLVALSEESQILRDLFNYRFEAGDLEGHTVGNLFLSALEKINGNFSQGLEVAMKILKIKGEVIPVTNDDTRLVMKLKNGEMLKGEAAIYQTDKISDNGVENIILDPRAKANHKAIDRIKKADIIVIGPGGIYCAIIPNLLVKGISEAIVKSKAKIIYVANLVGKKGQTENLRMDDYADLVNRYLKSDRINYVLRNSKRPSSVLEQKYTSKGENLVEFSPLDRSNRSYRIIEADLLSRKAATFGKGHTLTQFRSLIRHDSNRLARLIVYISEMGEYKNLIKNII